jgi:catechol 2,3-dioxygenase-like lactoylglutathione lyase family enzyme
MAFTRTKEEGKMKIVVTSVMVDDQEKALRFYTDMLGFEKKHDIPMGHYRWLTVVSKGDPNGVELLLEPDEHPSAKPFKTALVEDGIPATTFGVDDIHAEHARLCSLGVHFTQPPVLMGPVTTAVLDDTCGNLIQIAQKH